MTFYACVRTTDLSPLIQEKRYTCKILSRDKIDSIIIISIFHLVIMLWNIEDWEEA